MNTILSILGLIAIGYVVIELATAVYIYRNRATLVPRIFAALRHGLGVADVNMRLTAHDATAKERFDRLERKINYIGKHTQFERQELRRRGILAPAALESSNVTSISDGRRN